MSPHDTKKTTRDLKAWRHAQDISIANLAKRTKIHRDYLEAIESGSIAQLSLASIYKKNFIRTYACELNLDPDELLDQLLNLEAIEEQSFTQTPYIQRKSLFDYMHNLPQVLRSLAVIAIVATLITYLGTQVKNILEPPQLVLYSPTDGYVTLEQHLAIEGKTDPEVLVSINGKQIRNDESGAFSEDITLTEGINVITVRAEKKHGKDTSITRHVIVKPPQQFSFNNE